MNALSNAVYSGWRNEMYDLLNNEYNKEAVRAICKATDFSESRISGPLCIVTNGFLDTTGLLDTIEATVRSEWPSLNIGRLGCAQLDYDAVGDGVCDRLTWMKMVEGLDACDLLLVDNLEALDVSWFFSYGVCNLIEGNCEKGRRVVIASETNPPDRFDDVHQLDSP